MNDPQIESKLRSSDLYEAVLSKLAGRESQNQSQSFELYQILTNPDQTIKHLLDWIANPKAEFAPFRKFELQSKSKTRTLYTAEWPDRIVLMALQQVVSEALEPYFSEQLYSFRKGRGVFQAHAALRKYLRNKPRMFISKRDISDFGDAISRELLMKQLETVISREKNPLLYRWLDLAIAPKIRGESGQIGSLESGIPSGSPLTPVLENVYLMKLDLRMDEFRASNPNCFYARYGDDFVFASANQDVFQNGCTLMDRIVQELRLVVSSEKKIDCVLGPESRYFEWIGASFHTQGTIAPRPKHFHEFYQKFKNCFRGLVHELAEREPDLNRALPKIETALNQFLSVNTHPQMIKILQNKSDPHVCKTFDQNIRRYLVRWISIEFRIGKKRSWKALRSITVPSLNFQRRMRWKLE